MKDRITVRMSPEMLARLDAWIADQSGYVSRQEAMRRCVQFALSQSGPTPVNSARDQEGDTAREDNPPVNRVVFLD